MAEAVAAAAARLDAAGIPDARREARILLVAALNTDAAGLLRQTEIDPALLAPLLARRVAREPMAYILGRREFWGLSFAVTPAALIPRPDSETLLEAALAARPDRTTVRRILDLGTGTGCLLLAALTEFGDAYGIGVDLWPAAAALAQRNAVALGLGPRAAFLASDWAAALDARFDLVLCNPPYITSPELAGLMPEVARYEPRAALDGGADGLDAYRAVLAALPALLAPGGVAVLELGAGQAPAVMALAEPGFIATPRPDLSGQDRALILRIPEPRK